MDEETRLETADELESEEDNTTTAVEPTALEQDSTEIDEEEFSALLGAREYEASADIEQLWMREIGSVPLLSNKAVVELARKVEEGETINEVDYG